MLGFRTAFSAIIFIALVLTFDSVAAQRVNAQEEACREHAQLNRYERSQFLEFSMGQRSEVVAQSLAEPGCAKTMVDGLRSLGARVLYTDERSGFALVSISKDKLLDIGDLPGLEYAYTREDDRSYDPAAKVPQSKREPKPVPQIAIPYPRVAKMLSPDGPFFSADSIGLADLWREHPEADGRGTRVAVADEGLDLLHPELQEARDADGRIVPKVADLDTLTTVEEDASWVQLGEPLEASNGSFTAAGRSWIAPAHGTYRFGIYEQDLVLGPEIEPSHSRRISLSVGVLRDEQSGNVWVDTDGDGSFKDERALGDYGQTHDIDWFGAKDGDDDNRIPFGLKIDPTHKAVYIRIGGEHGNFVSGALAGNTWTGGLYDGTAPSAQVIDQDMSRGKMLAPVVTAFARPDVDVVNRSGGIGRAGYTGLREGAEDFAERVLEREIAIYHKPMACYCDATGTILVDDYAGPEMLRRNRQLEPPYRDTINGGVPFVPNGLVNVVLAPSANLETDSRYKPQDLIYPDRKRRMWENGKKNPPAPDGYVIGANNSPTIPVVSGLLADLISEAKREHIRYNAVRLNNAVFTGTRLLDGFPLSQQGYGLINAAQSWTQLAKMAKADDPANPELTSFTLSRIEAGHGVEVQGFQADLANVREKLNGEIWITRRGGYAGGRKYVFSLRGDFGDYELVDKGATLERDKPARVRFRTNGASGWNIVFLELRDIKADVVMEDVPLSVRVPDVPEKVAPGVDRYISTIPPLRSEYRYVRVEDGIQAARYVMRIPYNSCCSTRDFPGSRYREGVTPPGEPVDSAHHVGPIETLESLVTNNEPGTQAIFWENRGRPEYATQYDGPAPDVPIHAELTVTKYAVGIAKTQPQTISVTNQLAAVDGRVELYDTKIVTSELHSQGNHGMSQTEFEMPANLAQWRVKVTGAITGAHTDAYLFNCAGKNGCSVVSQQEIGDSGALLIVDKPQTGMWRVIIRSREEVTGDYTFKVTEAQLTPTQTGAASIDIKYGSGEKWTMAVPKSTQYAAFCIAGTPGVEREKDGLVIAMTPLTEEAP